MALHQTTEEQQVTDDIIAVRIKSFNQRRPTRLVGRLLP